jgi:hypothetical protein
VDVAVRRLLGGGPRPDHAVDGHRTAGAPAPAPGEQPPTTPVVSQRERLDGPAAVRIPGLLDDDDDAAPQRVVEGAGDRAALPGVAVVAHPDT